MNTPTSASALLAVVVLSSCTAVSKPEPADGPWGRTVLLIQIESAGGNPPIATEQIRSFLKTEVGKTLLKESIQSDVAVLWNKLNLRSKVQHEFVGDGVKVIFRLQESEPTTKSKPATPLVRLPLLRVPVQLDIWPLSTVASQEEEFFFFLSELTRSPTVSK